MMRKNDFIHSEITEKQRNLIEDSLYKNEIKKYLIKKIDEGVRRFLETSEEAFKYWDSLKNFFDDNFYNEDIEFKNLYWKVILNWELNRNRELYIELSML